MNTIKTEWPVGNYSLALEAEVDDTTLQIAADYGLRWLAQRQTEVDKVLGAFEKVGDKLVRKTGWKRGDVPYTPEIAEKLAKVFEKMEFEGEGEATHPVACVAEVTEYIREKAAPKFTDEKAVMTRHEKAGDLKEFMAGKIGYAGDLKGEDGEWHLDALRAIRAFVKSM